MVSQSELTDVPPWLPEHFIGGHPALDFVNTLSHRRDPTLAVDRMNTAEKIAGWCVFQRLLSDDDAVELRRYCASGSRETAFVSMLAALRGASSDVLDALTQQLTVPAASLSCVLKVSNHGGVLLVETPADPRHAPRFVVQQVEPKSIAALIALEVIDVVFRLPKDRLRACPSCGWLFFDSSRGKRRRWCSMKDCGNREKVRRHYRAKRIRNT